MPTYQYACTECGHAFDQFQNFSDDALTTCPECEGKLRKVFNAVGVVFKGSGFYRNDSRSTTSSSEPAASSNGEKSETKSDTSTKTEKQTETKTGNKSETKSDSKPAASTSSTPAS